MKILTYNIRYDNPQDGANIWHNRRDAVMSLIRKSGAHIFCVQECMSWQKDYLEKSFPEFGLVGVGRADGWLEGEMVNIFYHKTLFDCWANGDFWLSETPNSIGSVSWGSALPRLVSWIKLWDKQKQKAFFVFNTHFDHESQQARQKSAYLLHQKVLEIAGEHTALITGDFNLTPSESTYKILVSAFNDLKNDAPNKPKQKATFNGFTTAGMGNLWIDYIFAHKPEAISVQSYTVLDDKINGIFPSDHFPILLDFDWATTP